MAKNSICFGMTEDEFRKLAKTSVVNFWNSKGNLVRDYGLIEPNDVFVTWQCKAIENFKALLGVSRDGDDLYFEFTLHYNKNRCYLDVYHKEEQIIVDLIR